MIRRMPLMTCSAKLNVYFSDLRSLLLRRDSYLDNNNLIHNHQYGFRNANQLNMPPSISYVDYLNYEMELKRTPINLYLDVSKAIDSLSHTILITKLKHYGTCDVAF